MLGAIIGDIAGSVYEFNNIKTTKFPFFTNTSEPTDDTVMTVAVSEALLNGGTAEEYIKAMQKWGRLYPGAGYGGMFGRWLHSTDPQPYNSFGNGSAMRVSPVSWFYDTLEEVEQAARISSSVTHNHPEGIKGAQATAAAVFMARKGASKEDIRHYIVQKYGYDLSVTADKLRPKYKYDVSCQGSVPPALALCFNASGYEQAIRDIISIGGDSDTLAAIGGAAAEALYGIPADISKRGLKLLDARLREQVKKFSAAVPDLNY